MECCRQGKTKVLGQKRDKRETLYMKIHFVPQKEHFVLAVGVECVVLYGKYGMLVRTRVRKHCSVDGMTVLKCILKWDCGGGTWPGLIWVRIGRGAGFCECGDELLSSIKGEEFLE